jgi:polyisoprenoid-binding protein YceI
MATWKIDPAHTEIGFSARHMMVSTVRGKFSKYDVNLDFDPANPTAASVEATIDASSLDSGVADRDNHLRSADFLDVANHPNIHFKSKRIELTGDNTGRAIGDLTIRGVTREVTLNIEYLGQQVNPWGATVAGFSAETKINREDWGLTWNVAIEAGGVLVGKEIKITIDAEFSLVPEAQAEGQATA